jgi:hypothetical protein
MADRRPAAEVEHHDFDLFNTPEDNRDEPHDPAEIANLAGFGGYCGLCFNARPLAKPCYFTTANQY